MSDLEVFSYAEFGEGIALLAEQVRPWHPEVILGVVRGGLFVSAGLSYALGIKDVRHVNVEFYTDVGETLPAPVLVGQRPELADLAGRRVLIAEDVADTGATLDFVRTLLPEDADCKVAVLYRKPWSTYQPDFAWRMTERWIRFPWSAD